MTQLEVAEYTGQGSNYDSSSLKHLQLRSMSADMGTDQVESLASAAVGDVEAAEQQQHGQVTEQDVTAAAPERTVQSAASTAVQAEQQHPGSTEADTSLAAAACGWLPALVSCCGSQLSRLQLHLAAPLPPRLQPLLLRLSGLTSLSLAKSPMWQGGSEAAAREPVLLPSVVCELSRLQQLQSLSCTIGPCPNKEQDIKVGQQETFWVQGRGGMLHKIKRD